MGPSSRHLGRWRGPGLGSLLALAWLALGQPGCGNESNGGGAANAGGEAGAGASAGGGGDHGGAGGGNNDCFGLPACAKAGVRDRETCECRPCSAIDECGDGQTCHLGTGECREGAACQGHEDCGRVSACSPAGICEPNRAGGPCARESNCPSSEHCTLAFCGCTTARYRVSTVAPDVLLVLDRSDSMNEPVEGVSKWDIARAAIDELVSSYQDRVRFGLWLYPGTTSACAGRECDAGQLSSEAAPDAAEPISQALEAASTCALGTPTAEALAAIDDAAILGSAERSSYVVLITDGKSTCDSPAAAAKALFEGNPSVPTYVIGFGGAIDPDELQELAMAGGTAESSPAPGYYVAQNAAELGAALLAVAGNTLPCSFDLASTPKPHGSETFLYFGETAVPRDPAHQDGWDYDINTNRVTVYGPACDALSSQQVTEASLVFTCSFEPL